MRICVDTAACVGYGVCESLNDEMFLVEAPGPVEVLVGDLPAELEAEARIAVENCPTGALSIEP